MPLFSPGHPSWCRPAGHHAAQEDVLRLPWPRINAADDWTGLDWTGTGTSLCAPVVIIYISEGCAMQAGPAQRTQVPPKAAATYASAGTGASLLLLLRPYWRAGPAATVKWAPGFVSPIAGLLVVWLAQLLAARRMYYSYYYHRHHCCCTYDVRTTVSVDR